MADYETLDPRDEQGMQQNAGPGLVDQWRGFLASPQNRAFLMQTGLAMMQPVSIGQSGLGHFANSIAQGGEAANRVSQQEEATAEGESRRTYRAQTGEAAQAKGEAALMRGSAAEMNANTRAMLGAGGVTPNADLNARMRIQGAYNRWLLQPDLGFEDPILTVLGVKTKAEVARDPVLRKRAIELLSMQNGTGLPTPTGGNVGGIAEDNNLIVQAREAIMRRPQNREQIIRSYLQKAGPGASATDLD